MPGRDRKHLIDVAAGRAAADTVIRNVELVNVLSREVHAADIVIAAGRVAAVLAPNEADEGQIETIDGRGLFAAPGFIDPHVHIESSMLTVSEYARMVIPRGTTMIAADPHEIGNVLGIPGMRALLDEASQAPLRVSFRVPGKIPAMPDWLETSNAEISVEDTRGLFDWPEAVCLAGDINPNLVVNADEQQLRKFDIAEGLGKMISGQSPGLRGRELNAFLAAGPEDSHVAGSVDEVIENTRMGMASILALRPGRRLDQSHMAELAKRVRQNGLDTRQFQLCTDDIHAHDLLNEGHIDHRLRVMIKAGFDPVEAYQFATINVAQGLRIGHDHGAIAPGRVADIVLLSDLEEVAVESTVIAGKTVYRDGAYLGPTRPVSYPDWTKSTIRYQRPLTESDFQLRAPGNAATARVRVLVHSTDGDGKQVREADLPVIDGLICPDAGQRVNMVAMVERHGKNGDVGLGFAESLNLKRGALACSVNHDAHNVAVFGMSRDDMAVAANRIAETGGGYVLVRDGQVVAELALPVAGLMSEETADTVAMKMKALETALETELGGTREDKALIHMNFLALPNIPHFGFTDKGLISSAKMELTDTVVKQT